MIVYPQSKQKTHEHPDIDQDKMIDDSLLSLIILYHIVFFNLIL